MSTDYSYGEISCQAIVKSTGKNCVNGAYYKTSSGFFCGVHSKNMEREELKKDSEMIKKKRDTENVERQKQIEASRIPSKKGDIIVTKLLMRKPPQYRPGYLAVFPNRDDENRSDGLGISCLSPMLLGPVNHVMKNFPPAENLENYYQFAKVYDGYDPRIRINGYIDKEGKRHGSHGKGTEILYSVYYSLTGEERKYNYIQSRFFYCHYYEKLSKAGIEKLRSVVNDGYNIQIFGYDGHEIEKTLNEYYEDESLPFGHEMVIYSILTIDDPEQYPWNIYKEKHADLYVDMI